MDTSDPQLLTRIAIGDSAALTAFYDRHAPRVLGMLLKLLRRRDEAEDVLQETFCQVWTAAARYDVKRSSPLGWLLMLARSRALDQLRRRRPMAPVETEPALRDDPAQELQRDEQGRQVRAALERLPEEQRSAISLAYYSGLTHEQVADRQAIPLGTVKTRIRLGMQRLRGMLAEGQGLSS